jgi:hypothetical protein
LGFYGGDTIIFGGAIFQYMKVHKLMEPIAIKILVGVLLF